MLPGFLIFGPESEILFLLVPTSAVENNTVREKQIEKLMMAKQALAFVFVIVGIVRFGITCTSATVALAS